MNRIEDSVRAIQNFQQVKGRFLRVVGQGSSQHLEAVNLNWFGRLLMWLGCSNASMVKVAKFVAQHIDAFCSSKNANIQNDKNAFGHLIVKMQKFDKRHPHKITSLIQKIGLVYGQHRLVAPISLPTVPAAPISGAKLSLAPVNEAPKGASSGLVAILSPGTTPLPSPTNSAPPSPLLPSSPPLSPLPPVPILPLLPVALPPPPPVDPGIQEAVDKFNAVRGHIGKVKGLLQGKCNDDVPNALLEMNAVRALLRGCENYPERFAAVIKEMTPDEIELYVAFDVADFCKTYSPIRLLKLNDIHAIYQSIFSITSTEMFKQKNILKLAVEKMSIEQLKKCIVAIIVYGGKKRVENGFYNVVHLILQCRTKDEQRILGHEILKQPNYHTKLALDSTRWEYADADNPRLVIDTFLAELHLENILKDPTVDDEAIQDFIRPIHGDYNNIHKHSILQNRSFLDRLSTEEQDRLGACLVKDAGSYTDRISGAILIKDILVLDNQRVMKLCKVVDVDNFVKFNWMLCYLRQGCDEQYILYILRDIVLLQDPAKRNILIEHLARTTQNEIATLNQPNFVKGLTDEEILAIGSHILRLRPRLYERRSNPHGWESIPLVRDFLMKKPGLVLAVYQQCLTWPGFKKWQIPRYLYDIAKDTDVLDALVQGMAKDDREAWTYEINFQFMP